MRNGSILMSRLFVMAIVVSACATAQAADSFAVSRSAASVLNRYCIECHGGESAEGNVRLDALTKLGRDERLELLNEAQEQLYFGLMPPDDAEQPSESERELLAGWISGELKRFGASKLEDKLRKPEYGNYVDHDKLFSGEHADLPGFTYDRRWLISEFLFNAKFNRILNHKPFLTIDGMILYFPENGEGHHSWGTEAPFVIMAGDNCKLDIAGRYIRLPYHGTEGHKTLGNWYTTLLNVHGNPIKHYGDLDLEMSRKKLDQTGPIKQFVG